MAKSLNRVQLIGNLTRDPELRYTPSGTAVCSFGMATNRSWTTDAGEKKEEADFHRIVSWNKLAEICSQFLTKGRKVYVEGRLSTRTWTGQDGAQRTTTEVIIDDMILLDNRGAGQINVRPADSAGVSTTTAQASPAPVQKKQAKQPEPVKEDNNQQTEPRQTASEDDVAPEDIPF